MNNTTTAAEDIRNNKKHKQNKESNENNKNKQTWIVNKTRQAKHNEKQKNDDPTATAENKT